MVAAALVRADDEIMLITTGGVLIRTRVSEIREMGRATQGVTLISLDDGTKLSGLQRMVENDADTDDDLAELDDEDVADTPQGAAPSANGQSDAGQEGAATDEPEQDDSGDDN